MALTDKEIMDALSIETRQKIDNAFEALTQGLPTDNDKLILYRVLVACKLQPTDTVFSIMAALHYYLRLYDAIPSKIEMVSGQVENAGQVIQAQIGQATSDHLHAYKEALETTFNEMLNKANIQIQAAAEHATEASKLDIKQHIAEIIKSAMEPALTTFNESANTTIGGFKTEFGELNGKIANTQIDLNNEKIILSDKVNKLLSAMSTERGWSMFYMFLSSFLGYGLVLIVAKWLR